MFDRRWRKQKVQCGGKEIAKKGRTEKDPRDHLSYHSRLPDLQRQAAEQSRSNNDKNELEQENAEGLAQICSQHAPDSLDSALVIQAHCHWRNDATPSSVRPKAGTQR